MAMSLASGRADTERLSRGLLRIAKGQGGLAGLIGIRLAHYRGAPPCLVQSRR